MTGTLRLLRSALSWAHNVRLHTKGVKRFNQPVVGELELGVYARGAWQSAV